MKTYVDTAMIQDAIENIILDQQAYFFGPEWMTKEVGIYLSKKIKNLIGPSDEEVLKVLNLMWLDNILIKHGDGFIITHKLVEGAIGIDETKIKSKPMSFKMTVNLTIECNQ